MSRKILKTLESWIEFNSNFKHSIQKQFILNFFVIQIFCHSIKQFVGWIKVFKVKFSTPKKKMGLLHPYLIRSLADQISYFSRMFSWSGISFCIFTLLEGSYCFYLHVSWTLAKKTLNSLTLDSKKLLSPNAVEKVS